MDCVTLIKTHHLLKVTKVLCFWKILYHDSDTFSIATQAPMHLYAVNEHFWISGIQKEKKLNQVSVCLYIRSW